MRFIRLSFLPIAATAMFAGLCLVSSCSEQGAEKRVFDIPEGPAPTTLRLFAEQAEVDIIFENSSFESAITRSVKGEMLSTDALQEMLVGTDLSFYCDERSRSYAISREESQPLTKEPDGVSTTKVNTP